VERILVKDLKSVLHSCKCPLDGDPEARVSRIEEFLGVLGVETCKELIELVPCGPKGWEKTRTTRIADIS
jgi:hypothetical protein